VRVEVRQIGSLEGLFEHPPHRSGAFPELSRQPCHDEPHYGALLDGRGGEQWIVGAEPHIVQLGDPLGDGRFKDRIDGKEF